MTARDRIAAFFTLADRGLRSAVILFQAEQFEDTALFVQQVVERVARALLTHAGIPFGTSHNLGQMAEALPQAHAFRDRVRSFDDLSVVLTAYRYPTASGNLKEPPDIADLRKKLDEAERLVRDAKLFVYGQKDILSDDFRLCGSAMRELVTATYRGRKIAEKINRRQAKFERRLQFTAARLVPAGDHLCWSSHRPVSVAPSFLAKYSFK
jgi:HEPN domain-containing protein